MNNRYYSYGQKYWFPQFVGHGPKMLNVLFLLPDRKVLCHSQKVTVCNQTVLGGVAKLCFSDPFFSHIPMKGNASEKMNLSQDIHQDSNNLHLLQNMVVFLSVLSL